MYDINQLEGKLLPELKEIAKDLNIKKLNQKKQDLIYAILDEQALKPTAPKSKESKAEKPVAIKTEKPKEEKPVAKKEEKSASTENKAKTEEKKEAPKENRQKNNSRKRTGKPENSMPTKAD